MSQYMTEEEQLEAIKAWWRKHNQKILMGFSLIFLLIAGFRYWHWHQYKINIEASAAYEELMLASSKGEDQPVHAYANQLIQHYGKTPYADAARLVLAKHFVQEKNLASAEALLSHVGEHAKMPALQQVARLRLVRLLAAEKAYPKALSILNNMNDPLFNSQVNELKGDIYWAEGEYQKAFQAYKMAANDMHRQTMNNNIFLEMKTNALAGFEKEEEHHVV